MYINTTGLVLRETAYKDSSKILTVLTGTEGKLTVSARGALRKNSKLAAPTQLLVFSEMTLLSSRGRWTLTEAQGVEQFSGLRSDISLLALGSYFAELLEAAADEDSPSREFLPLCLNALYALSEGVKEPEYVKPAFELRLMAASGFAPLIARCAVCGRGDMERGYLDLAGGTIRCGVCGESPGSGSGNGIGNGNGNGSGGRGIGGNGSGSGHGINGGAAELGAAALDAARYVLSCDPKKLYSFKLPAPALRELGVAAEAYVLAHMDRGFRTLDYYWKLGVRG